MKKNFFVWSLMTSVCMGGVFTSCGSDDNPEVPPTTGSGYVLAASADAAAYLLTPESLDNGSVSSVGNGTEVTSGTAWVFYKDKYLYNLQYNQGSAGVTESYRLDSNGAIVKRSGTYNITRFTTYGVCGDKLVTVSAVATDETDNNDNAKYGLGFTFISPESESLSTSTQPGENYLHNGEYVTFAGIVEANGKVYTSVVPMGMSKWGVNNYEGEFDASKVAQEAGGQASSGYEAGVIPVTQYPDSAYIAIYDNVDFSGTPTIVRTGDMGFACGRNRSQYYQTFDADNEGNLYVFSPGYGRMHTSNKYSTPGTLGASVKRINAGATEFDASYGTVDLESLTGGRSFMRVWHITGDYFLLQMFSKIDANASNPGYMNARGTGATSLGIYQGSTKSYYDVTGVPSNDKITSIGGTPYCENGCIYVAIVTSDGNPTLYKIDPTTHTATAGLSVRADGVSAVGKLTPQN